VRIVLFPILLLQAVAVFAQPTVSAEVSSDLLRRQSTSLSFNTPAVSMANDQRGVAIAWVMPNADGYDRISVARLDRTGHIAGTVHVITMATAYLSIATAPSIAATGQGFVIAWLELPISGPQSAAAAYCRLDAELNPVTVPSVLPVSGGLGASPPIVRSGKTTWITAAGLVWQIQTDGSLGNPLNAGFAGSDMTVAADYPQVVSGHRTMTNTFACRTEPGCIIERHPIGSMCNSSCYIFRTSYALQFVALYQTSAGSEFAFDSNAQPTIANDGHDILIAWFRGTQSTGGAIVATRLNPSTFASFSKATQEPLVIGSFAPDSGQTRPDIASDGERFVVVWRTLSPERTYDVVGASVDRNGNVVRFPIAATTSDEKDPSVIALGPGKFLVAYEKIDSVIDRRIAGRFVTFEERSHAVR
jgi:hypothetical protein